LRGGASFYTSYKKYLVIIILLIHVLLDYVGSMFNSLYLSTYK